MPSITHKITRALDHWAEPQPLAAPTHPEEYPLDALPDIVRSAVDEVQRFVQAPAALVAGSAIGAISMAIQHQYDIERASRLSGPTSVYLLAVAASGERKTTLDHYFTSPITEWQKVVVERVGPEIAKYESAKDAWEIRKKDCIERIRQATKEKQDTSQLKHELAEIKLDLPESPRLPHILRGDETPESLAHVLRYGWPSAGIVSSEAGIVLGSHSMGSDSVMRNLALLNVLWDGGEHRIGRRSKESFTVRGARLTMALQVQPETLRQFFVKNGDLARGTGFMARFLICAPESTQGTRLYRDPPDAWPALDRYNSRIRELLDEMPEIDGNGSLCPAILTLSPAAKAEWVKFHNEIEIELRQGGELFDVRDVASKTADNAARLAALFHVFSGGTGPVSKKAMLSGQRIAEWHLSEARRFFESVIVPPRIADALEVESWIVNRCKDSGAHQINRREIQQYITPGRFRDNDCLSAALADLEAAGHVRLVEDGKKKIVEINPHLLGGKRHAE